jgi:hypothetical protein
LPTLTTRSLYTNDTSRRVTREAKADGADIISRDAEDVANTAPDTRAEGARVRAGADVAEDKERVYYGQRADETGH